MTVLETLLKIHILEQDYQAKLNVFRLDYCVKMLIWLHPVFLHIFEQYAPAILGQRVQGLGPPNIFRSKGLGFRVNYGRKLEVFNLATVFCSRNACFSAKT